MKDEQLVKKRIAHIDLLEAIAIFIVVLEHSILYSYDFLMEAKCANYLIYFFRTIYSIGVPLFFFTNGYLLLGKKFDLNKHIRKIIKFVILTVVWGIITLFLLQIIRKEYFTLRQFLIILWNQEFGWIHHLWFMGTLVCIYFFYPLLKQVYDTNRKIFIYFTIVSAVLTCGNVFINEVASVFLGVITNGKKIYDGFNFFNIFNPFRDMWWGFAFVYFCVGGLIYSLEEKIQMLPIQKRNVFSVFGILLSCLGLWGIGIYYSKAWGEVWDVGWNGFDTIFTFFCVIFVYILSLNWKYDKQYIRIISCNTLGIYFIHWLLVFLTRPYLQKIEFLCNVPFNLIYAFVLLCLSLILSLILKKIPIISNLVK